jgi:hypothetical protein
MSSRDENRYYQNDLVGNVDLPLSESPSLRGSVRRLDPDGGSSVPYVPGLDGTSLSLNLSIAGSLTINFTSDGFQDAIDTLNAEDPTALYADEIDGFLRIRNLNGGGSNFISVTGGDAAPLLGFVTQPEPGYISFAGEVTSSPPHRGQRNPQGTVLITRGEDLTSKSINRALYGSMLNVWRSVREVDLEITGVISKTVLVETHTGSGKKVFTITLDPTLRIPVTNFGISGSTPSNRELDSIVQILNANDEPILNLNQLEPRARVLDIYYNDGSIPTADNTQTFADWGTMDGRSIFGGSSVATKNKHPATSIGSIRGNIVEVPGATFQSNGVSVGDTVVIEGATNTSPFSHNGEFLVDRVIDEERLSLRPKSVFDAPITDPTILRPSALNSDLSSGSYGTLRVVIGNFMSAFHGLMFEVPSWVPESSYRARFVTGMRAQHLNFGDFVRSLNPSIGSVAQILRQHIIQASSGFRHHASHIDASAVGDLSAGTIEDQLTQLSDEWLKLDRPNTITADQTFGDGTNLVFDDTAKIKTVATPAIPGRHLLWQAGPNALLQARLYFGYQFWELTINAEWDSVGEEWNADTVGLRSSRFRISNTGVEASYRDASGADPWADNAWEIQEGFSFDVYTLIGSLFSGLNMQGVLSVGLGLLGSIASAAIPRITAPRSDASASARTCIMELGDSSSGAWRVFVSRRATDEDAFEITHNARWDDDAGTYKWYRDVSGTNSIRVVLRRGEVGLQFISSSITSPWVEGSWSYNRFFYDITTRGADLRDAILQFQPGSQSNPSNSTAGFWNQLRAKNLVKSWGRVSVSSGTPTVLDGINCTVDVSGGNLEVSFPEAMQNDDYCVVASVHDGAAAKFLTVNTVTSSSFTLSKWNSAGSSETFASGTHVISFIVMAQQGDSL